MSTGSVMIMAGGTGGHVFPGLAVAEALIARNWRVVWLGTRRGIEARVVPERGIDIHFITITGIRGKRAIAWVAAPFRIAAAIWQARMVLRRSRPSVVLGMGGFVAGPGGIAAWLCRIPLLIHEQNSIAGTTNRILARFARRVFEGFPGSFPGRDAETIGNPVRASICDVGTARISPADSSTRPRHLLVLGGSQGALALNRAVPEALARIDAERRPVVRHQAGASAETARSAYTAAGIEATVDEFIEDMAAAYAWADFVVARAGALTIAELAATGLGAILVPFPFATDDHQTGNARQFAAAGAGLVLPEAEADPAALTSALERCLAPERVAEMSRAALAYARPGAAGALVDACIAAAEVTDV